MKKLQASTLTEVIVALVIISLVTSMFFAIIIKVGNYHRNRKLILINQKILECIQEAKQQGFLEDETLEYEGYFLQKRVKPFKNITGVFEVEVEAFSLTNKRLGSHKAIVEYVTTEEE